MTAVTSFPVSSSATSGASSFKRIAIFAATVWEVGAVRAAFDRGCERRHDGRRVFVGTVGDREFWLVRTGVGRERASRVASWLLQQQPFSLVVSAGFACALTPAKIGDLLVGIDVLLGRANEPAHDGLITAAGVEREAVLAFATGRVSPGHIGRFVSVDHVVGRASEKKEYARLTGAIGLDMESAALAMEAERAQVPFIILRTVSDLLDEDLPLDFNLFLRPTGWLKGIGSVLMAPWSLCGLGRLRRQSRIASDNLTQLFRAYVDAMTSEQVPNTSAENA